MGASPDGQVFGGDEGNVSGREQWYLLREDLEVNGVLYRAGTPVLKVGGGWCVNGVHPPQDLQLEDNVCKTEYAGLSLHLIARDEDGWLTHRRLGSRDVPERIALSRVLSPPNSDRGKLYLSFGDQFYPLEFFGW
jgi:hypothetical protein